MKYQEYPTTALTGKKLSVGWTISQLFRNHQLLEKVNMQINYQPLKRKFGVFVIVASLFELVGCATSTSPYREKFDAGSYVLDCNHATEQKVFLESVLESAKSEKWKAQVELKLNPFTADFVHKEHLASGGYERELKNKIFYLQRCEWNRKQKS
jgi:hypothetical protein